MTDDDERYFAAAKAALEAAKQKRGGYRGDCKDCRYSRTGFIDRWCTHPAVTLAAFNGTDSYDKKRIVDCGEQRDTSSLYGPVVCGPNGVLFEEKRTPLYLLRRLWGALNERQTDPA